MQFLIRAYDGEGMLEKRMEVRQRHIEGMAMQYVRNQYMDQLIRKKDNGRIRCVNQQGMAFGSKEKSVSVSSD